MKRLRQWCEDATAASATDDGRVYRHVFVDEQGFERHPPKTMAGLAASFTEYQA
jgi:type III restriction enzyme